MIMKLNFSFIVVLSLIAFSMKAQITITIADAPTVGMIRYQVNDTTPSTSIVQGVAGANQTWNFSGLNTSSLDTLSFLDPTATPYVSTFPTATLVVKTKMNNYPAYIYLIKDNSGVYAIGIAGVLSTSISEILKVKFIPKMSFLRTPSSYQSNYNEIYHYIIKTTSPSAYSMFGDSVKVASWTNASSTIDSWGSLTTPGGTFNTIRQYERDINHDTIWFRATFTGSWFQFSTSTDTSDTYKWWTNTIGNAVAELKMNLHQNKTKSFGWYVSQPTIVEQLSLPSMLSVYPNPAAEKVFIGNMEDSKEYIIKIFDIIGKEVQSITAINTTKTELSLQNFDNGVYFVSVYENYKKIATKRIIVNN